MSDEDKRARRAATWKRYYEKHKQKLAAYYQERDRARRSIATPSDRERRNRRERERYAIEKLARLAKARERYAKDRENYRAKVAQRKARNPEHHAAWSREYAAKRRKTDPQFRIAASLRARVGAVLRGTNKSASSLDLVGCSWRDLRLQIEARWLEGMTWENYGRKGWHIDHIRPLASFDLDDPDQRRTACHYTNLQPLWWRDNLSKGAKC